MVVQTLNKKKELMKKYTLAEILAAWEVAFGENMEKEYPGFIQHLTEGPNEKN